MPRKITKAEAAHRVKQFAHMDDAALRALFDSLGARPGDRTKGYGWRKGFIKIKVAQYGDHILDELKRRRDATST